ncbi:MAG: hypothetical protein AB2551_20205 [Candidatus Thiodiazotropha sp.]
MSEKKDHFIQITVAVIGAVAAILAAVIAPLVDDYLDNNQKPSTTAQEQQHSNEQYSIIRKQNAPDDSSRSIPEKSAEKNGNMQIKPNAEILTEDKDNAALVKKGQKVPNKENKKPSDRTTIFDDKFVVICGYPKIKAKLIQLKSGKDAVRLTSTSQNIPNSSFRGYENTVPTGEIVEIWKDCLVEFNFDRKSGITRIEVAHYRR